MYGLVNRAIEDLVCSRFGEDTWSQIRRKAGIEEAAFGSMDQYPDQMTYQLVAAASDVLETPAEDLLEAFGEYWTLYTAQEGYGDMMAMFGESFVEFLENLDQMHSHVAVAMPDLQPPSFRCEHLGNDRYCLHYHSQREGLAPMVMGLIKGLARKFDTPVSVNHRPCDSQGPGHDTFLIDLAPN